jgi:hypothetical protein
MLLKSLSIEEISLMFLATDLQERPITPALLEQARKLEEQPRGLHVLAAREFRYPVQQQKVTVQVEHYRTINLLEKFILRAYREIAPAPAIEELANALGLDTLFLKTACDSLMAQGYLSKNLRVTEEGEKAFSSENIAEESETTTRYFVRDLVQSELYVSKRPLVEINHDEFEDFSPYLPEHLKQFPAFEFQLSEAQLREWNLDCHKPDEGSVVGAIRPEGEPELCWRRIAIFVLYHETPDKAPEQCITFQAYSARGQPLPIVAEQLTEQFQQRKFTLKTLCELDETLLMREEERPSDDTLLNEHTEKALVNERLEELHPQVQLPMEEQSLEPDTGTARQLRDVEIRQAFLAALQNAREQVIIYSPWINQQVVDEEFLILMEKLVQRGVHILIGYGIERDESKEERSVPLQLLQRMRAIQTAEGVPGVIVEWLGNSHAKEVIVDSKVHFSGSQNWLSYRGDRFPRGETVYCVTIVDEVEKAYQYQTGRFIERARKLWSRATEEECRFALCILCYLKHEQEAVEWLQRDKRYYLIPFWLQLARQAIISGQEARILVPLHRLIRFCSSRFELRDPLKTEIATALHDVLRWLMLRDRQLAVSFISDNSSALERLGLKGNISSTENK